MKDDIIKTLEDLSHTLHTLGDVPANEIDAKGKDLSNELDGIINDINNMEVVE